MVCLKPTNTGPALVVGNNSWTRNKKCLVQNPKVAVGKFYSGLKNPENSMATSLWNRVIPIVVQELLDSRDEGCNSFGKMK